MGVFKNIGLSKQHGPFWIKSEREEIERNVNRKISKLRTISHRCQGMKISDKVQRRFISSILQINTLAKHAQVITQVDFSGRLNS